MWACYNKSILIFPLFGCAMSSMTVRVVDQLKGQRVQKAARANAYPVYLLVVAFYLSVAMIASPHGRAQDLTPVTDADFGLKIVQFDVGQADAAALLTPDGKCCVIDLGRTNAHGEMIATFLADESQNGVQSFEAVDVLVVTHYDLDHIGGAQKLGDQLTVKAAYDQGPSRSRSLTTPSGRPSGYGKYAALVGDPNGNGIEDDGEEEFVRRRAEYGDALQLGNAELTILSVRGDTRGEEHDIDRDPSREDREHFDENPGSIILLVKLGAFEFLTGGDATCEDWVGKPDTENSIIDAGAIPDGADVDVVKINHHGSDTSSGERYIVATRPEVGIISSTVHSPHYIPKKTSLMMLDRIQALTLVTGAAIDHEGHFVESSSTGDDDYELDRQSVHDEQANIVILVSSDGSRYTVRTTPASGGPREWTFSSADADNPHPAPLEDFVMAAPARERTAPVLEERLMTAAAPSEAVTLDLEGQDKLVVEVQAPEATSAATDAIVKELTERIAASLSQLPRTVPEAEVAPARDVVVSVRFPDKLVIQVHSPPEKLAATDCPELICVERLAKVFIWPLVVLAVALLLMRELRLLRCSIRRRSR
jgi:beta-lactamase superfamily II metal-dependent hydrolase